MSERIKIRFEREIDGIKLTETLLESKPGLIPEHRIIVPPTAEVELPPDVDVEIVRTESMEEYLSTEQTPVPEK